MKLNQHEEELYGCTEAALVKPLPHCPLGALHRDISNQGAAISDRHREDEILGGAHGVDVLLSNILECPDMTSSSPNKLIRWFDSNRGTRFYLVTAPLRQVKTQLYTFAAVTGPIYRPIRGSSSYEGDFNEETFKLVNVLFGLGGIKFVFCNAYALQIRKLADASWESLHGSIIDLLDASLFNCSADVDVFSLSQAEILPCWAHLSLEQFAG